jgi:hypothetical protein
MNALTFSVKKNSPLIMTVGGIAGLCGTALLAYKAHGKVKTIVEDIEARREAGEEINKMHELVRVGMAVAPTILMGAASVSMILGSYHVLTNRNSLLASALSTALAENERFKQQVKKQFPDAVLAPVEETKEVERDGKKVVTVNPKDVPTLEGVWFHLSNEFVKDDLDYNQTFISAIEHLLDNKLNDKSILTMNDVYTALAMEPTKQGAVFGWTSSMFFELEQTVHLVAADEGEPDHYDIWIKWPQPVSIYDKLDYSKSIGEYWY